MTPTSFSRRRNGDVGDAETAWRCGVCGYVHRADTPPQWCPVCGAARDSFQSYVDLPAPPAAAAGRWTCLNCGHIHVGAEPPDMCPVCAAAKDRFGPLAEPAEPTDRGQPAKVVVIGAGVAGVTAAESVRAAASDAEIILIAKERDLPYYRLNLTRHIAGEIDEHTLPIHPESWYDQQGVQLRRDHEVARINPDKQTITLHAGETVEFEKLILAAGAHPFVPPIPGVEKQGVTSLRTIGHTRQIIAAAQAGATCVCLGGGILGLETAGGLARRGANVTLVESFAYLLARQLDRDAGRILADHVRQRNIRLVTQTRVVEILGDERVHAVKLDTGQVLPADLVVVATGVRSNSCLAREAGLEVNQGVIVDDHLTSSHPHVLAAGDVAEHRGIVYGLWGPAQYQGHIAGLNAVGITTEFGGIPRANTLKVLGVDLFSIGQIEAEDGSYHVVAQETDGTYFRFLFRDNRLVGAILLGDTRLTASVKASIENKTDVSKLLRTRPSVRNVLDTLKKLTTPV